MAIYKDPRIVKEISIPSIPDSKVEIYDTLLWGDLEEIYGSDCSDLEKGRKSLARLIKDWNLTEEVNGKQVKLPINEEVFKRFTADVVNFLLSQTSLSKQEKKK